MEPIYDLFSRLPNGSPLWLESIEGLEQAEKRMEVLARLRPGDEYFMYSENGGGVIRRIPESHSAHLENHLWQ
jgi:hypothetical protein